MDKNYAQMDVGNLNNELSDALNELDTLYTEYNKQTQDLSIA